MPDLRIRLALPAAVRISGKRAGAFSGCSGGRKVSYEGEVGQP